MLFYIWNIKNKEISNGIAYLKLDKKIVGSILALGIAPFIMQATESLVLVSLNN